MVKCPEDTPAYDLATVVRLASSARTFNMRKEALLDALNYDLDDNDVREWLCGAIEHQKAGNLAFWKCRPTEKFPPGTCSDYYRGYPPGFLGRAFIKFAIYQDTLIVTSFKEDDNDPRN